MKPQPPVQARFTGHLTDRNNQIITSRRAVPARILAKLIDMFLSVSIVIGLFLFFYFLVWRNTTKFGFTSNILIFALTFYFMVFSGQIILFLFEKRSGQSPGKKLLKLKVTRADGGPVGTKVMIARALLDLFLYYFPISLVELLAMSLRQSGKRFTDDMTGTRVVPIKLLKSPNNKSEITWRSIGK